MKNKYLLTIYLVIFLGTTLFYVPSENNQNDKIQYINLLSSTESIDFKRYFILQLVCFITFLIINTLIEKNNFNLISLIRNHRKILSKIAVLFLGVLLIIATGKSYEYFILKPRILKAEEISRIENYKKDSTLYANQQENIRRGEILRENRTHIICNEKNAKELLKNWVSFYHKDSKIISKIDIIKVDDCMFKASFRIKGIEYYGLRQGVVCRIILNPEQPNSISVFTEEGFFF
jgi:hypothetical protein